MKIGSILGRCLIAKPIPKPMEIRPSKAAMAKKGESPTAINLKKAKSIGRLQFEAIRCNNENATKGRVHKLANIKDTHAPVPLGTESLFLSCILCNPNSNVPLSLVAWLQITRAGGIESRINHAKMMAAGNHGESHSSVTSICKKIIKPQSCFTLPMKAVLGH